MNQAETVHSYDEWSLVKEIIVGRAGSYRWHHVDASFALFYFENIYTPFTLRWQDRAESEKFVGIADRLISELNEDLEELVEAIKGFGATVLRPAPMLESYEVTTPYWSSRTTPALNVRDQTIVLGKTIVETAPHVRARLFENDLLKPILYKYFEQGSPWISMPRPTLARDTVDASYFLDSGLSVDEALESDDASRFEGLGHEIIFDGAQCIRMGRDVLVNVANRNHELGYKWLVRTLGHEFTFHRIYRLADNHVDSIVLPLRPGVLLLRSPEYLHFLPAELSSWDIIYAPEVTEARFPVYDGDMFYIASKYIDMNVLSLDENTVIVNALYPELVSTLEAKGFAVIPVQHRHRRLFGGGFHCFTLDCVRAGGPESYLR